ncbi:hypothetical protein [Streptomyces boninensis]|uniref:hypothetical protein n=1 Tax=Streptomyces boninensis TaxID=2039455 RepID=UPI003B20BCD4
MAGGSAAYYLAYFLIAQNRLHLLYEDPADVFRVPYDRTPRLFDNDHEEEEVFKHLPTNVQELLTDDCRMAVPKIAGWFTELNQRY